VELSVLIQQTAGNVFRAWCGEPISAAAEGATREEALTRLRAAIETKTRGVEVIRLSIGPSLTSAPVWPNDEITRDWLVGIAKARETAELVPEPWTEPTSGQP
jgi:predicted RNase H-like HicB family nuclease